MKKKKIEIKDYCYYSYFLNEEKDGKYYFWVNVLIDKLTLDIFFKIKPYLYSLFFLLVFIFFYNNDIKVLTMLVNIIKENFIKNNYINTNTVFILNIIAKYYYLIIILIIILFLVLMLKFHGVDALKEYVKIFIYKRINWLINVFIFINIVNITLKEYVEYNFFFVIIILISIVFKLIKSIIKKEIVVMEITHFTSLPIMGLILSIVLLLLNSKYFLYWFSLTCYKYNRTMIIVKVIDGT